MLLNKEVGKMPDEWDYHSFAHLSSDLLAAALAGKSGGCFDKVIVKTK